MLNMYYGGVEKAAVAHGPRQLLRAKTDPVSATPSPPQGERGPHHHHTPLQPGGRLQEYSNNNSNSTRVGRNYIF
jgi:hypothetical protein